jgi:hypothetical protein
VKGTLYIRIDASTSDSRCGIVADPSLRTSLVPSTLLWGLCTTLHRDSILTTNVRSKLSDGIPYGVLSVLLPGITDSLYTDSLNYVTDKIAWGIYRGLLQASGYQETSDGTVYAPGGSVTPYKKVVLDNTITCISATNGSYAFYGVDGSDRKIHTAED